MIDFREIKDPEIWELFARDFLQETGFYIESTIDREPDGKKDLIVTENLKGNLGKYQFRWIVSCKHFANREKGGSVKEDDEPNILERIRGFRSDGFIGFYSTVPSSGLNSRLNQLKEAKEIKDYRIFDFKLIENYLIRVGYSQLLMRYFPDSYKRVKPLHLFTQDYIPILCDVCGKDLLEELYSEQYTSVIAQAIKRDLSNHRHYVHDVYFACKGPCDQKLDKHFWDNHECTTSWEDIGDLMIPSMFLRWVLTTMNQIKSEEYVYSENAYKKEKQFIMGMA